MKTLTDAQILQRLHRAQAGVFSKGDLQTALAEHHPAAFVRRVQGLLDHGVLRRFCRGWYVSEGFDLATLSQRISPGSYISFGTVLAQKLIVGPRPEHQLVAVKVGHPRVYRGLDKVIEHVSVTEKLMFGFSNQGQIRYANAEKAVLDVLYFHLRGRRYPFDIYSDLDLTKLDMGRIRDYMAHYSNTKFIAFAQGILDLS